MIARNVKLLDGNRAVVATARVTDKVDHFSGTIDLTPMPADVRVLFDEFEEIVNGQLFSYLDDIQHRIGMVPLTVLFDDGFEDAVRDLQVYPSTLELSFRLVNSPVVALNH